MEKIKVISFLILFVLLPAGIYGSGYQSRRMAVTFDDLPGIAGDLSTMTRMTHSLLNKLQRLRIPAVGFVNGKKTEVAGERTARTSLLEAWLEAGFELGNHTYSHIRIDQKSIDDYRQDVIRGESILHRLLEKHGQNLRYFRHPQLRTGPTPEYKQALDLFLSERGYITAPVTIDNNEYIFAAVYARAKKNRDRETAVKLLDGYIAYMEAVTDHFERLSREFLGYEIPQTLLLHANELNADHFDKLAEMFKHRGYSFITLEEALEDKAYRLPEAQVERGLSWIHRWMIAAGKEIQREPDEPSWLGKMFKEYR